MMVDYSLKNTHITHICKGFLAKAMRLVDSVVAQDPEVNL